MGPPTRYAIGSYVQALEQNPGLEEELRRPRGSGEARRGRGLSDSQELWHGRHQML